MTNSNICIPFDAHVRQQMLAEMHLRNGISTGGNSAMLSSSCSKAGLGIASRTSVYEQAGNNCSRVVTCER